MNEQTNIPELDFAAISKRLNRVREFLEISKTEMADSLDYTRSHFVHFLDGTRKVNADCLHRLSRVHNVNSNYLLYGKGGMFLNEFDENVDKTAQKKLGGKLLGDVLLLVNEMLEDPEFARTVVNQYIRHDSDPPRFIKKPESP